ncbi:MAG: hypothetical protein L6R39_003605, partial [Caloplaca ligustica]
MPPSSAFQLQEQQPLPNAHSNISAPPSSHLAFAQRSTTSAVLSATPEIPRVNLPRPPVPQPLQPLNVATSRPPQPPLRSAPLYPSRRAEYYSDPTDGGINSPREGYSDYLCDIPPQGTVGGPHMFHRMPAAPRLLRHAMSTLPNPPKPRAPIFMGPSNDARVLEKQGVASHRGSFGEGRMGRRASQSYGQQMQYAKPYHAVQQNSPHGAPSQAPQHAHGQSIVQSDAFAHQVLPPGLGYPSTAAGQGSIHRKPQDALRDPLDNGKGLYADGHTL